MIYESINNTLNENAVNEGRAQALWKGAKAFIGPRQDGQTRWEATKQAYGREMYNTGQRLSNRCGKYNNNKQQKRAETLKNLKFLPAFFFYLNV